MPRRGLRYSVKPPSPRQVQQAAVQQQVRRRLQEQDPLPIVHAAPTSFCESLPRVKS
jgi:hypothetical protein